MHTTQSQIDSEFFLKNNRCIICNNTIFDMSYTKEFFILIFKLWNLLFTKGLSQCAILLFAYHLKWPWKCSLLKFYMRKNAYIYNRFTKRTKNYFWNWITLNLLLSKPVLKKVNTKKAQYYFLILFYVYKEWPKVISILTGTHTIHVK